MIEPCEPSEPFSEKRQSRRRQMTKPRCKGRLTGQTSGSYTTDSARVGFTGRTQKHDDQEVRRVKMMSLPFPFQPKTYQTRLPNEQDEAKNKIPVKTPSIETVYTHFSLLRLLPDLRRRRHSCCYCSKVQAKHQKSIKGLCRSIVSPPLRVFSPKKCNRSSLPFNKGKQSTQRRGLQPRQQLTNDFSPFCSTARRKLHVLQA